MTNRTHNKTHNKAHNKVQAAEARSPLVWMFALAALVAVALAMVPLVAIAAGRVAPSGAGALDCCAPGDGQP